MKAQWAQSGELLWCLRSHKPAVSLSSPLPQGFHMVLGCREGCVPEQPPQSCVAWAQLLSILAAPQEPCICLQRQIWQLACGFSAPCTGYLIKTHSLPTKCYVCFLWWVLLYKDLWWLQGSGIQKREVSFFLLLCLFFFFIILGKSLSLLDGREERLYQNKLASVFYLAAKATQSLSLTLSISWMSAEQGS